MYFPLLGYMWWGSAAAAFCFSSQVVRSKGVSFGRDGEVCTSPKDLRLVLWTPQVDRTLNCPSWEKWVSSVCWRKNKMDIWWLEHKTESGTCCMLTNLIYFFLSTEKIPFPSFLFSLVGASNCFLNNRMWAEMMYITSRYCIKVPVWPLNLFPSYGNHSAIVEKDSISR